MVYMSIDHGKMWLISFQEFVVIDKSLNLNAYNSDCVTYYLQISVPFGGIKSLLRSGIRDHSGRELLT